MRSSLPFLLVTLGCLLAGGCTAQRTLAENSAVDLHPDADGQLDFWDELAQRRVVTNDDALHGLILLATNEDPAMSYGFRVNAARHWGWLPDDALPPTKDESASLGMIAVAVCDILNIEGGVTMSVFGPSARYCTRELVYEQILPMRSPNQSMTGLEFIDLMGRVEDIMPVGDAPHRFRLSEVPPEELPGGEGDPGGKVANVVASAGAP